MLPVIGFPSAAAVFVIGSAALALCADAKLAMQRAGMQLKEVAIDLQTREPKLSAQLNGQEPFTLFWRFSSLGDAFWREFNGIRAQRFGQRVVPSDIGRLIESVEGLKHMAKMSSPSEYRERESA